MHSLEEATQIVDEQRYFLLLLLTFICVMIGVFAVIVFFHLRRKNALAYNFNLNIEIGGALREAIIVDDYLDHNEVRNRMQRHSTMVQINQLCGALTHNILYSSSLKYDLQRLEEFKFKTLEYCQYDNLFQALIRADQIFYSYISKKYYFFKLQSWFINQQYKKKNIKALKLMCALKEEEISI